MQAAAAAEAEEAAPPPSNSSSSSSAATGPAPETYADYIEGRRSEWAALGNSTGYYEYVNSTLAGQREAAAEEAGDADTPGEPP